MQQRKILAKSAFAFAKGTANYLKYDDEIEYFPKKLMPLVKSGDYVFNAGISSYLSDTLMFSKYVGNSGRVFCFEPEPCEFAWAKTELKNAALGGGNIRLVNLGLWSTEDKMEISCEGSSSSAVNSWQKKVHLVDLVSLDHFVKQNRIKKVDFIKMDIEGAEPEALKGCEKVIKKFTPGMAICVYHRPEHLYNLILYINSINSGYNFYIYHHSTCLWETCMYAVLEKNIFIRLWKRISFYFKNKVWRSKRLSKIFLKKMFVRSIKIR